MKDNINKKDYKTPRKRTFAKTGSSNKNNFDIKKKYISKYPADKENEYKKYGKDKPYSKDDSKINKSYESKYNKPFKNKKSFNRDEKAYSRSYERKETSYLKDKYSKNEGEIKKKLIKASERKDSSEANIGYGSEQGSFRKKLIKKDELFEKTYNKPFTEEHSSYKDKTYSGNQKGNEKKLYRATEKSVKTIRPFKSSVDGPIRLNKYIASSGICSRREADELIASGAVSVNGKVVTEMGVKVLPTDIIQYGGETLKNEKNVYLLLNKPKDFITTSDDPYNRKTVMSLVHKACKERIYPVGRLDRMTTGLLLFTNDGEMAKKLTHPTHGIKKIYQVGLDKALTKADMLEISKGIELEDGVATVDVITYIGDGADKKSLGLELHSGKNRIVRRIFEHFGYKVVKLDRVYFAGLTKKDLPRGRHRFLTDIEINMLKIIG